MQLKTVLLCTRSYCSAPSVGHQGEHQEKQAKLEQRVIMLRPGTLDLDMVEEQSRRMLNFTHQDDVVVIFSGVK